MAARIVGQRVNRPGGSPAARTALLVGLAGCGGHSLAGSASTPDCAVDARVPGSTGVSDGGAPTVEGGTTGHCGASGESCCAGATCTGSSTCAEGTCAASPCTASAPCTVTLASGQFLPRSIAADGTDVYWTNLGSGAFGSVVKVAAAGGAAVTLAPGRDTPRSVIVSSGSVYWAEAAGVMSVPVGGGSTTTLATVPYSPAVATDGSSVYWVDTSGGPVGSTVMSVPVAGGTPVTVEAGLGGPWYVQVNATDVYWGTGTGLFRAPKTGGATTTVSTVGRGGTTAAFLSSTQLSWVAQLAETEILTVPLAGGAPATIAAQASSGDGVSTLVADDVSVYWTSPGTGHSDGAVLKAPVTGGAPVTLATGQNLPQALALDATSVYWINLGAFASAEGSVMKRTPR